MQRAIVSIIATWCALLLLLLCPLASAQPTEGVEFEAIKNLVVMIEGKLGEAPTYGAGIVFANQGGFIYVATAFHVVRKGENSATGLKIRFAQKPDEDFAAEHHPRAWYEYDLAVIRVKTPPGLRQFQFDRLAEATSVKKGDKVYAIGYPGGSEPWGVTYNPGFVRTVLEFTLTVEAPPITVGHSGGALFDQRSLLVGMVKNTDGVVATVLRMDKALETIRRELELPVQLSLAPKAGSSRPNAKDGLEYIWIPPGRFIMGCSEEDTLCDKDESPPHEVEIGSGFWMGQTEVTQAAYRRLTTADPSKFKGAQRPVESVSWQEANNYCLKAGLRLPTEAEWEYAARAGSTKSHYGGWGEIGWHSENSSQTTHDVGGKQANRWTLYDMLGNVWEWVADRYDQDSYKAKEGKDPKGPGSGSLRVMRGKSWINLTGSVRVSDRGAIEPASRSEHVGFRCAGELP